MESGGRIICCIAGLGETIRGRMRPDRGQGDREEKKNRNTIINYFKQ